MTSAIKPPQANLIATETEHRASYDGTGYRLILWPFALGVLGVLGAVVYGFWVDPPLHSLIWALFTACLFAPMMALLLYLAREFTGSLLPPVCESRACVVCARDSWCVTSCPGGGAGGGGAINPHERLPNAVGCLRATRRRDRRGNQCPQPARREGQKRPNFPSCMMDVAVSNSIFPNHVQVSYGPARLST